MTSSYSSVSEYSWIIWLSFIPCTSPVTQILHSTHLVCCPDTSAVLTAKCWLLTIKHMGKNFQFEGELSWHQRIWRGCVLTKYWEVNLFSTAFKFCSVHTFSSFSTMVHLGWLLRGHCTVKLAVGWCLSTTNITSNKCFRSLDNVGTIISAHAWGFFFFQVHWGTRKNFVLSGIVFSMYFERRNDSFL